MRLFLPFTLLLASLGMSSSTAYGEPSNTHAGKRHIHVLENAAALDHPSIGSSSAPVTFEFFFNVGNARSFGQHKVLLQLAKRHPKRLRIIYRLTDNRERSSSLAQIFGREAFEQGRFFEFLTAFYAKRRGPAANKDFPEVAKTAGVDYERVKESLENMRHDEFLNANHFYWRRMHVPSVPGLLVNGHTPARLGDIRFLEALYDQAYEESRDALASGVKHEELGSYLRNRDKRHERRPTRFTGPTDKEPGEFQPASPRPIRMHELLRGKRSQGPDDAKVTMVFICHLQSNNCRTMTRSLRMLQRSYKGELKLIVHALFSPELPRQDKAQLMHEAAGCAEEQGAFWEYYRLAFEKQRQINFDTGFAVDLASSPLLDIDVDSFETCLDSGRYTAAVQDEVARVRKAGVTHVPALAVGGLLYTGRLHFDQLRALVDAELAPGLLGSGRSALGY
jgi:protein-disulfide isomerase